MNLIIFEYERLWSTMILSGIEIKNRLGKDIIIKPFDIKNLNPNSYNLHLGNELLVYRTDVLDIKTENPYEKIIIPEDGLIMTPGVLYLGKTEEYTETTNLVPALEGRSSIGRLGLSVHITAGFGDVGYRGNWTLELHCIEPIRIYPGIAICQIYYHEIMGDFFEYDSQKYQDSRDVKPSLLWKEF